MNEGEDTYAIKLTEEEKEKLEAGEWVHICRCFYNPHIESSVASEKEEEPLFDDTREKEELFPATSYNVDMRMEDLTKANELLQRFAGGDEVQQFYLLKSMLHMTKKLEQCLKEEIEGSEPVIKDVNTNE